MVFGLIGAGMVATSILGIWYNSPKVAVSTSLRKCLEAVKLKGVRVHKIHRAGRNFTVQLALPHGVALSEFSDHKEVLEQSTAGHVQIKGLSGGLVELKLGYEPFRESMEYPACSPERRPSGALGPFFYTPYGVRWLDFWDETNCHLIVGGATRMGKTVLIRLLTTSVLRQTDGKVRVLLIDNKVSDVYMFRNIPQVQIAETVGEARMYLNDLLQKVIYPRKQMLNAKGDVIDAVDFRKKYPKEPLEPIFVIIDEYGRFADDEDMQNMVVEIAETYGYLDVHLVIAAQRPDASQVLNPRIKANIVTRICFSTANETNSKIVLDLPDAAHLGMIQGRAYLLDSILHKIQIPYLSSSQAETMLKEFYKHVDESRQIADPVPSEVPGFVEGPSGEVDLPRGSTPPRNRKPNRKTT